MKSPLKAPCQKCPFRRVSIAGWLGSSTPREFMEQTLGDSPMPCHCTVDYSTPNWREEMESTTGGSSNARFCAGAIIFFSNMMKLSRDRMRPALKADKVAVFSSPAEFFAHHHDWQAGEKPKVDMGKIAAAREALFTKKKRLKHG